MVSGGGEGGGFRGELWLSGFHVDRNVRPAGRNGRCGFDRKGMGGLSIQSVLQNTIMDDM